MYLRPQQRRTPRALRGRLPVGASYVGEDDSYYYIMHTGATDGLGGIFDNIGNMFSRMVKFTPKSFTPGNIYKGFVNTTLTTATGGLYQVLPKNLKKTVYEVGKVAIPVIAGGALALAYGPAVMGILGPKLTAAASLLGKGSSAAAPAAEAAQDYGSKIIGDVTGQGAAQSILQNVSGSVQVGGQLMNLLAKLPQAQQAKVAEQLTPEQIASIEKTGQIPPELKSFFDQMAQRTFNPPVQGVAPAYDMSAAYGTPAPSQAGMLGGMDSNMLLLIGVPAAFFVLQMFLSKK